MKSVIVIFRRTSKKIGFLFNPEQEFLKKEDK